MKFATMMATGVVIGLAACATPEVERDAETGMAIDTVSVDSSLHSGDETAPPSPGTHAGDTARLQRQMTPGTGEQTTP